MYSMAEANPLIRQFRKEMGMTPTASGEKYGRSLG